MPRTAQHSQNFYQSLGVESFLILNKCEEGGKTFPDLEEMGFGWKMRKEVVTAHRKSEKKHRICLGMDWGLGQPPTMGKHVTYSYTLSTQEVRKPISKWRIAP